MHHEGNSRLEMLARDDQVEIVTVIMNHAHTGQPGDGKRYVADLLGAGEFRRKSGARIWPDESLPLFSPRLLAVASGESPRKNSKAVRLPVQ